ncbi:MAG: aldo/keto reductase [Anaerolineae bacterium]|nr:aldo/keto reductase [Anaerolineae bacterium]MCX8068319.1 aldo/keto reductase [Anaerolineae bacterium]MDW7991532.1 aldo/keto reductase [Anaerolineae bacterium]
MKYRRFGRIGWEISEIGLGAWPLGGDWGQVDEETAMATLHRALDLGINFFDTADVYGDGLSEQRIGRLRRERSEPFYVATKAGRRLRPHTADGYNKENLTRFVERSLRNLGVESLDLLQLHCPPTEVYYRPEVFQALDDLKREGKIQHYGVSVEKVEEALKAIEYPGVESVQIIFNIFRQRPAELFFQEAQRRNVAVIVRVPLASGLLTGKMTRETTFPPDDHRNYNREGKAFDVGETFAGVPFEVGLEAVEALRPLVPSDATMAQFALRWILMFEAVSVVIPGAKSPRQIEENARASDLPPLTPEQMARIREVYDTFVRPYVHHRW